MLDAVDVKLSPAVYKRVRFEAAWRQHTVSETIEALVLAGLKAQDKETPTGTVN